MNHIPNSHCLVAMFILGSSLVGVGAARKPLEVVPAPSPASLEFTQAHRVYAESSCKPRAGVLISVDEERLGEGLSSITWSLKPDIELSELRYRFELPDEIQLADGVLDGIGKRERGAVTSGELRVRPLMSVGSEVRLVVEGVFVGTDEAGGRTLESFQQIQSIWYGEPSLGLERGEIVRADGKVEPVNLLPTIEREGK